MTVLGFTDDKTVYDQVIKFKQDAITDGWSARATYENHESIERACTLEKNGFTMMILSREGTGTVRQPGKWQYEALVSIWGNDGLAITPPAAYDWQAIVRGMRHCNNCGKDDVATQRYSFAGRCCKDCLPEMRKEREYPGWTD